MKQRVDFLTTTPNVVRAMLGLHKPLSQSGLEKGLLDLVYFRVSQMNGCAFCLDMHSKDPDIDSYSDDEVDECPWSVEIDVSDGAVIMSMVWSRVDEIASYVIKLAERHDLSCYDPQEEKLYLAPSLRKA